jgi:regulator of nucleoside diphosphate kinase
MPVSNVIEEASVRGDVETIMTRRRIFITDDDMARLRDLVRRGKMASRRDQDHLEELDRELDRAEVVATAKVLPDVVTMHSTVRVRDLDSGQRMEYTIVFPGDADIEKKRISIVAPIGTALIGYRAGDTIEWATPGGLRRLEIEEVLFQPEAAGDAAGRSRRRPSSGSVEAAGTRFA